jgi:hypothetical protein
MPTIPEQLMENTERFVRDCFEILGDRHDDETIRRVVLKLALTMSVEISKHELALAALDSCFTREEQERARAQLEGEAPGRVRGAPWR